MNGMLKARVVEFYDTNVAGKLEGFIEGNLRVECAWETVERWARPSPARVLELGCAVGDISWRMHRLWPNAEIVGVDISPKSIELARSLFASPNVSFINGTVVSQELTGRFDLVVMLDVYEHIAADQRGELHERLKSLLSDDGQIVLSFPTPEHLAWLRRHAPEQIQPIDEDVSPNTILTLASETDSTMMLYRKVSVWHEGDYAHAIVSRDRWKPVVRRSDSRGGWRKLVGLTAGPTPRTLTRWERLARVRKRLGVASYP